MAQSISSALGESTVPHISEQFCIPSLKELTAPFLLDADSTRSELLPSELLTADLNRLKYR